MGVISHRTNRSTFRSNIISYKHYIKYIFQEKDDKFYRLALFKAVNFTFQILEIKYLKTYKNTTIKYKYKIQNRKKTHLQGEGQSTQMCFQNQNTFLSVIWSWENVVKYSGENTKKNHQTVCKHCWWCAPVCYYVATEQNTTKTQLIEQQ